MPYITFLLVVVTFIPAWANEPESLMAQADAAYAKREDVPQDKIALITYEKAAESDPKVAVDAYWKASRAAWWMGEHAQERAERLDYYQKGMDLAQNGLATDPNCAECHFWLGSNQGSYGDTKGVMKSLSMVKPIRHEMNEVIRINDKTEGGSAYQVLGVVDYKVPGLFGGNKKRAKEELDKAMSMSPNDPFNHYYLAEYYKVTGNDAQKKANLEILRTLQVAPDSVPELKMLQERALRELQ